MVIDIRLCVIPGSRCVDRLDASGQRYWKDEYNVHSLEDGKAICPFKGLGRYPDPVAAWIPSEASVDAMVRYHKEVTSVGYDGIYIVSNFTALSLLMALRTLTILRCLLSVGGCCA